MNMTDNVAEIPAFNVFFLLVIKGIIIKLSSTPVYAKKLGGTAAAIPLKEEKIGLIFKIVPFGIKTINIEISIQII